MRSFWILLKNKKNLNDLTKNPLEVCSFYKLAQKKMHRPVIITSQGQCKKIQDTYMVCEYYIISFSAFFSCLANSFVHIIMYTYYAMSAVPFLRKYLWWKKYLTQLQLVRTYILILYMSCLSRKASLKGDLYCI